MSTSPDDRAGASAAAGGTNAAAAASSPARPQVGAVPLVTGAELEIGYGQTPVCAPASFSVYLGEALFVVGANGAGKATLLRTCCLRCPAP